MVWGKTKIGADLVSVSEGAEQVIKARTSHRNSLLDKYRRLVISMLTAVTALEQARADRTQMTAEELNELADRKCPELSPLERQVHDSILELEKFRIQVLRAGNHATVKTLDRILEHERTRFARYTEAAVGLLQRYGPGRAKRS